MLTVNVGHGQLAGSAAAKVLRAARASAPSAPPAKIAAYSR